MSLTNSFANLLTNLILKAWITKILDWNDEFDLPDGSYSISDIKDYFEYVIYKTWDHSR